MAQSAAGKTNWFAIWISVAVVAVLAIIIFLVAMMNNQATDPGTAPTVSTVDETTGAITFGDGPDTVATWVDFMCPYCGQFEESEGKTITELVDEGKITLEVHPVSILDRLSQGTEYSSRSASAMYAVANADPDNAYAFFRALYDNQPAESSTGLTDEELVQIAKDAGVNVTDALESDILDHTYIDFAKAQTLPDGATGTPTLAINGTLINVTFDPETDIIANLTQ